MKKILIFAAVILLNLSIKAQVADALVDTTIRDYRYQFVIQPPSTVSIYLELDSNFTILDSTEISVVIRMYCYNKFGNQIPCRNNTFIIKSKKAEVLNYLNSHAVATKDIFNLSLTLYPLLMNKLYGLVDWTNIEKYQGM